MDARHRYMATFVGDAFGKGCPPASIDAVISEHMELLNNFLTPAVPRTIYMMFQQELREGAGGEPVRAASACRSRFLAASESASSWYRRRCWAGGATATTAMTVPMMAGAGVTPAFEFFF